MSKRTKIVRGTKKQKRPSASYYYKELKKPIGYKVSYRPRKGGKYILHSLQVRKNGTPYWKALEKLTKKRKKTKKLRSSKIKKTRGKNKKTKKTKKRNHSSLSGG